MRAEINLIHGDCLQAMKAMQDKQFDLAIVDPPYGIGASDWDANDSMFTSCEKWKGRKKTGYTIKGWDKEKPQETYWHELRRVSKNQIVWGYNYFAGFLGETNGCIVWDKKTSGNFSDCEIAFVSNANSTRKFEWLWNGFRKQQPEERIHPTQKPVALYEWILQNYASEGDLILDTHLGSGSIACACWNLKYDLTAYEIDKEYYDAACKRFDLHSRQMALW